MPAAATVAAVLLLISSSSNPPVDGPGLDTALADDYAEVFGHQPGRNPVSGEPVARPVSTGPRFVRTYVPACEGNSPTRTESVNCLAAATLCAATAEPDDIGYWVFSAPVGSAEWASTGEYLCLGGVDPDEPPPVVPVLTGEDFRRLPLPASPIVMQPPNGRTLVNIPTNLYADADTVTLPTTILGQPVRVRATPLEFRWRYGDGNSLTTEDAGAPYPELRTAHVYRTSGRQKVRLATVYSGEYAVGGGPWLPVDGTATVDSPVSTLEVLTAENRLVS